MHLKSWRNSLDALLNPPDNLPLDTMVIRHVFHMLKIKQTPKNVKTRDLTRDPHNTRDTRD